MNPTPAFRKWFGDSKVVDTAGAPLVVYHGTNRNFDEFAPAKVRHNDDGAGEAYHFTSNPDTAFDYATSFGLDEDGVRSIPAFLSLRRPYEVTFQERDGLARIDFIGDALHAAKNGGYDGLIVDGLDEGNGLETHYIAFCSNQIRSAIGNSGDTANNDIRFSLVDQDEEEEITREAVCP